MIRKLRSFVVILLLLTAGGRYAAAQDPAFSQPYLSPIYLNPAATGAGENDLRFSAVHRRQYLTIPSQFNYTAISVDKYFPSKGGIGLLATDFSEGYLRRTGIYGSYAYTICSGEPNIARNDDVQTWFVSAGIQFGMVQRRIDYSKLVFSDQLDQNGIIPGGMTSADPPIYNKRWYPDFSGGLYFSHEIAGRGNLLLGGSAHHINRPDESLTSTSDTFRAPIPVLYSLNSAYQYDGENWVWGVAMMGYKQGKSNAFQIGVDVKPAAYDFSIGVWGHFGNTLSNFNAVCLNITYSFHSSSPRKQKFAIGFDQDFPVGGSGSSYTTGSSEIGITWDVSTHSENTEIQDNDSRCKPRINTSACPAKTN